MSARRRDTEGHSLPFGVLTVCHRSSALVFYFPTLDSTNLVRLRLLLQRVINTSTSHSRIIESPRCGWDRSYWSARLEASALLREERPRFGGPLMVVIVDDRGCAHTVEVEVGTQMRKLELLEVHKQMGLIGG